MVEFEPLPCGFETLPCDFDPTYRIIIPLIFAIAVHDTFLNSIRVGLYLAMLS